LTADQGEVTTLRKLAILLWLRQQAVEFVTGFKAAIICDWEGNRRFGVAVAMRHRMMQLYNRPRV